MTYSNETLAHRLKVKRAEAQMYQEDLARESGVAVDSIARYESGRNTPRLDTAYALAKALNCGIDDLVDLPKPSERKPA